MRPWCLGLLAALAVVLPARANDAPRLALPIDCQPGVTCFLQSHVDVVEGPEFGDFRCGSATNDGHKGVDFRVLSAAASAAGVDVLAAAPGTVKALRDGMPDRLVDETAAKSLAGRECGNGVVIDHGEGWETQYCHMRQGSVRVARGQRVERGAVLGRVGFSGAAEAAHLHLSVRHDGKVVEPFSGIEGPQACSANAAASAGPLPGALWDSSAAAAFPYRNGEIIAVGFAARPVGYAELEVDHRVPAPAPDSAALLLYVRTINLRGGDQIAIDLAGPGGFAVKSLSKPVERSKAVYVAFAGKRRTADRWPAGRYVGTVSLLRGGQSIDRRQNVAFDMP